MSANVFTLPPLSLLDEHGGDIKLKRGVIMNSGHIEKNDADFSVKGCRNPVNLKNVIDNETFLKSKSSLPIALGLDVMGGPLIRDLVRMPHLLIAGTMGLGTNVILNTIICSILFKSLPDEVKFIMIGTRGNTLSAYGGIPHLLHPVVLDPQKAILVLEWAAEEIIRRYQIITELGAKNIKAYNKLMEKKPNVTKEINSKPMIAQLISFKKLIEKKPKGKIDPGYNVHEKNNVDKIPPARLPYIVIIIDELADLMAAEQRIVEMSLARIARIASVAGIHLILATQRPSVDVTTGVIKANFPVRISLQVSSQEDSRMILDQIGAENLSDAGDMLFMPGRKSKLLRIHDTTVSEKEISKIVNFVKGQASPVYDDSILKLRP